MSNDFLTLFNTLAGVKSSVPSVHEALGPTLKQVQYAALLIKKLSDVQWASVEALLPSTASGGGISTINRHDSDALFGALSSMSKKSMSGLIDHLKSMPKDGAPAPAPTFDAPPPAVFGAGKATTAQIQYVMGMMAELGRHRWDAEMAGKYGHPKLHELKAMTKSQISDLIAALKSALL